MFRKMQSAIRAALLLVFWIFEYPPVVFGKEITNSTPTCPIGFTLVYKTYIPFCIRRKGPETYGEQYNDCVGNLYTTKLYQGLNLSRPDYPVWTEYRTLYPGGVFVDWSHTKTTGDQFNAKDEVVLEDLAAIDEDLCLIMDPVSNFTAVKCHTKRYRFCIVKPYMYKDSIPRKGCEGLKGSYRFWSPVSTCLTVLEAVGGGDMRATWNQAKVLCDRAGGYLLSHGWRYSNHKEFRYKSSSNHTYPLGIVMSSDYSSLSYETMADHTEIPASEWHFDATNPKDTFMGAIRDDFWRLVNSSYIFNDVICERGVQIKDISLNVTIDKENKLTLAVNDTLDKDDIYCFTDSVFHYPAKVKIERIDESNAYVLKPRNDGYYWCTHVNTKRYKATQSNKVLFIREKSSLVNNYTIKVKYINRYRQGDLDKLNSILKIRLNEYIDLRTRYDNAYADVPIYNATDYETGTTTVPDYENSNFTVTEEMLKAFQSTLSLNSESNENAVIKMTIKRLYLDRSSVLVHVVLHPNMRPVTPGVWKDIEILFMKPVFYCKGFNSVPQLSLGQSINSTGSRNHRCVGDFNEGVQWVETAAEGMRRASTTRASATVRFPPTPITSPDTPPAPKDSSEEETLLDTAATSSEKKRTSTTSRPTATLPILTTPATPTEVSTVNTPEEVSTVDGPDVFESTAFSNGTDNTTVIPSTTTTAPSTTASPPTTLPPEEQLDLVLQDLDNLINGTAPITVDDIGDVFNQVDQLFEHHSLDIPGRLLHLLDNLGAAIELNGSRSASAVRNNVALLLADADPTHPVRGMKIATRDNDSFTDEAFAIISEINNTVLESQRNEVVVHLPQSVSDASRRISFVVFRDDRAFTANQGSSYSVNSRVLSIKVGDVTTFKNGEVIDIHLSPITLETNRNETRTCVYWQFLEDSTGVWSSDGCTLIHATEPGMLDTCRCTHLTHFAEVLFPRSVFSQSNEDALELLTIIGCCLSIFGLTMVGVTAALFRSWRRDYNNKIWFQLCISIFLLVLSFLIIIFAKFDQYSVSCMAIGILLHYSVLSSFCWMLVAAVISYRRLVLVFTRDASHKLLRASAFAWGVPIAMIGVLLSAAPQSYAGRFEEKTPSGSFCYPSGLAMWLAVYAPIALIVLVNWTLFALIVRSVFASRGIQRHGDSNEALRCASVSCLLVFLFGLPWIIGLFAFNLVAAYLFTLTATYQGFVLFLFFVLGNKKTRDLWLNKLKIKQTRKVPVTSSTYSNSRTGWRGAASPSTAEAKASKPKSLNQDNSRFS